VQSELGTEVGHRPAIQMGIGLREPGVSVVGFLAHPLHDIVVVA
jgi:hypothetical protein